MSTINHQIKVLNQAKNGYDTYHVETNSTQVYDFSRAKWLDEIISEIDSRLSQISGDTGDLATLRQELIDYVNSEINKLNIFIQSDDETFVSTEGQSDFVLANENNVSTDYLKVTVGGVEQFAPNNFTKVKNSQGKDVVRFSQGLEEGIEVIIEYYGGIDARDTALRSEIDSLKLRVEQLENR